MQGKWHVVGCHRGELNLQELAGTWHGVLGVWVPCCSSLGTWVPGLRLVLALPSAHSREEKGPRI